MITFDNRTDLAFVKLHNANLERYCLRYSPNVTYQYVQEHSCRSHYWSKLYILRDELLTHAFDYVFWLDSDTLITDFDFNISLFLKQCSSFDILVGLNHLANTICSGVFIIKNTTVGRQFLTDCIDTFEASMDRCLTTNNTLQGLWAGMCFEQGVMNAFLLNKYTKNTLIVGRNVFANTNFCADQSFVLHYYGQDSNSLHQCFSQINL